MCIRDSYSAANDHSGLADQIGKITAGGDRPSLPRNRLCAEGQKQESQREGSCSASGDHTDRSAAIVTADRYY